ncbi:MAG: O-methyltransferase [Clostridia bacterium]|nr:O-methyltransferase [Clostridia bacterium]
MDDNLKQLQDYAKANHVPILLSDSVNFLYDIVASKKPKTILEIGTAIGYSGSIMLSAYKQSSLITIEKDEQSFNIAKSTFKNLGLTGRTKQILGDGYEEIIKLNADNQKFDFIFLDGPKGQYLKYYKVLLNMLTDGGCLLVDNVLFHGLVRSDIDVGHKKRAMITKLRRFLNEIENRQDLITTIHEIGDGIAEIYLK